MTCVQAVEEMDKLERTTNSALRGRISRFSAQCYRIHELIHTRESFTLLGTVAAFQWRQAVTSFLRSQAYVLVTRLWSSQAYQCLMFSVCGQMD